MTAHNAKSTHPHVSDALATAQPWVRDHYAALRAEAGPRLEHARSTVVPVLTETTTRVRDDYLPAAAHRVRDDYLPAAAHATSQLAAEAARRSAPYRAELASRSMAALAAARGDVTADDVAKLQRRGRGRKAKIVGAAALIGAVTGAGVVFWQRSHQKQWDQDDLVETVLDDSRPAGRATDAPADTTGLNSDGTATGTARSTRGSNNDGH